MKWSGIVNNGRAARSRPTMSVGRDAMIVLSQQVSTSLSLPACIRAALIPVGLDGTANGSNRKGPPFQVALKGGLTVGGLGVELIFRSLPRRASAFPRDLTTKATLVPVGQSLAIEDRSPRARAGSDPAAWVQVRDGDGVPLTDSIYVGRLGRGPCLLDPSFSCTITAETFVSPVGIGTTSELTLTGELKFDRGLSLRVLLRRREGPLWWGRRPQAVFDFEVVEPGHMIHFPAQPVWTGENAGTLRSLMFLDGDGEPIGNEHLLSAVLH